MQFWLSDQTRLITLVALCGLLWSLESIVPLYRYQARALVSDAARREEALAAAKIKVRELVGELFED